MKILGKHCHQILGTKSLRHPIKYWGRSLSAIPHSSARRTLLHASHGPLLPRQTRGSRCLPKPPYPRPLPSDLPTLQKTESLAHIRTLCVFRLHALSGMGGQELTTLAPRRTHPVESWACLHIKYSV